MIDDMTARRFSEATQKDYVRNVRKFAAFLGRSPDTATSDDLRRGKHEKGRGLNAWVASGGKLSGMERPTCRDRLTEA